MVDTKRVQIRISEKLLLEIDRLARERHVNRSQFIQNVVQMYMLDREPEALREKLRVGYQIMAELNLRLAEEDDDESLLDNYERHLAGAE